MDKDLLIGNFKEHKIFNYFWNDSVLDCFSDNIVLDFIPQEYIGFYQKVFQLPLTLINDNGSFVGTSSNITIKLTSLESELFNVDRAINEIDKNGVDCAIFIKVEIRDSNNVTIFSTQFNLGSNEAEKIETTSRYIKEISIFY